MSYEKNSSAEEPNDPKAKFREALEKKKKLGQVRKSSIEGSSKIHGDQSGGGAPRMFRRKSGSS